MKIEENESIQLRTLNEMGENQFIRKPSFGLLQPDNYGIHNVGYTNEEIPKFSRKFKIQFLEKATEINHRYHFV